MSRFDRGPFLLRLAVVLLVLTVAAYLVSDAQNNRRRSLDLVHDRRASHAQVQQTIEERAAFHDTIQGMNNQLSELQTGQNGILDSLSRIETILETDGRSAPRSRRLPRNASQP